MLLTGKCPSKTPEKLPSSDPFESDDIESVLAEAKEMVNPISSLSGKFHVATKRNRIKKLKAIHITNEQRFQRIYFYFLWKGF